MSAFNTRLRTSRVTDQYLTELQGVMQLSSKAAIARIAIALSLKDPDDPETDMKLVGQDTSGFEFQRSTLTGKYDALIKNLVIQHYGQPLEEDKYFPDILGIHLERGTRLLYNEVKYQGGKDKFYRYLFAE